MLFKDKLNDYMTRFDCSPKELSDMSGISKSVISRYRNGDRTPVNGSEQLDKLVSALFNIGTKNNISNISLEQIQKDLEEAINSQDLFDYSKFSKNLNNLISILNINLSEMSKYIAFDSSHISRIRYEKSKPSDPVDFSTKVCNYVITKFNDKNSKKTISTILQCKQSDIENSANEFQLLYTWLTNGENKTVNNYINNFLSNLDEFDLNNYIKAIKFDELKVPTIPFYKPKNRNYYGIEEMKKGELDFFKATVLSRSNEPVFMCSDMPMEDMAKDINFGKKWMFAIAMSLKRGLHLNIIHNVDRPFNEMMLGLESWIPIYMTGQVSPYYLKNSVNSIYCHFNYVSGSVALSGECVNGYHNEGKYTLTTNKVDLAHYKVKAKRLLNKATPLMEIYREENKNAFNAFLASTINDMGYKKRILSSLPLHTISEELLIKILDRNNVNEKDKKQIISDVKNNRNLIQNMLKNNELKDTITEMTEEDFKNSPLNLNLAESFYENKLQYNYEEYLEHLKLTKEFQKSNSNYKLTISSFLPFKNIDIVICENNWVMLSKTNNPSIHFVIHYPKLRSAIENFIPPVIE